MKWIKASDRLPELGKDISEDVLIIFKNERQAKVIPVYPSYTRNIPAFLNNNFDGWEWLDETEEGQQTDVEQAAKEKYPDETGTFLEMPNQSKVILQRKAFIAGAKWNQGKGETVNDDVKNLIEWLNQECPPDTATHELSHDFAENLRKRLNLIYSISPIQNK